MITFIRNGFTALREQYLNPFEYRRAQGLMIMNLALVVGWVVALLALFLLPLIEGQNVRPETYIAIFLTPALIAGVHYLLMIGNLRIAAWLFVGVLTVAALAPQFAWLNGTWAIFQLLPIVAAGFLLERREQALILGAVVLVTLYGAFNQSLMVEPRSQVLADLVIRDVVTVGLALAVGAGLTYFFGNIGADLAQSLLDDRRQLAHLQTYKQQLLRAEDEQAVIVLLTNLLMEDMLFTFAQAHLLDNNGRLQTYVRSGMGTRHTIVPAQFGPEHVIRQALTQKRALVVSSADVYERRSHFLPSVTCAVALPLEADGRMIGVLDIQSNLNHNPFKDNALLILELLAAEVAHALVRVRQKAELLQALSGATATNQQLEAQIQDLRRQIDQGISGDWVHYLQSRGHSAYGFDLNGRGMTVTPAANLPDHLKKTMQQGEIVIEKRPQEQIVNIPIKRADDVFGAMSFVIPSSQILSERQIETANAVANRLAIALDNARLVEQTRSQAERELKAGEISNRLLSQQEVRTLLDTAAYSFNEALGAIYTRIYLEPEALRTRSEEAL
jgi:GAF domain-containing protein